jgi:hypothetical protein
MASRAVIKEPACGDDAIPDREILRSRMAANGEFTHDGAGFHHLLAEFLVFLR